MTVSSLFYMDLRAGSSTCTCNAEGAGDSTLGPSRPPTRSHDAEYVERSCVCTAGWALCGGLGCQPMIAYIRKNPITYASATCQPCLSHSPTDFAWGYMLDSATPAEEPNQIIEPPKPTA